MVKRDEFDSFISSVQKEYGKEIVRVGLGSGGILPCEVISTGSLGLNFALGVGGVPRGRVIEVYGNESCGKTTLATHIVAEAQKAGLRAAYIDVEHAVDPNYTKNLGVEWDQLVFSQPDSGEQAMELVDKLAASGFFGVVVIDSVAGLVPQRELDGEIGDCVIGAQAQLMSKSLRRLAGAASRNKCCLLFINQTRDKIGSMIPGQINTPGGKALKFYASIRIEMRKTNSEFINVEGERKAYANKINVKVVKNKVAPPFQSTNFHIFFGRGISKGAELLELGLKYKVVEKNGSFFSYGNYKLGLGWQKAVDFVEKNPEVMKKLEEYVKGKLSSDEIIIGEDVDTTETIEIKED